MRYLYKRTALLLQFGSILFFSFYDQSSYAQKITQNKTGYHGGYYYSFWNDSISGTASFTLKPNGRYKTRWHNIGNFTAGKGWAKGKENRVICFSGKFNGGRNGFLAVYGWTRDSLVEYYIVENYGEWTPPGSVSLGTFYSDGGLYHIYRTLRVQQPSIAGKATFYQYWSVRTSKRSRGRITVANHVAAWKSKGMILGKVWAYQLMGTEGNESSGYSNVSVRECLSADPPPQK